MEPGVYVSTTFIEPGHASESSTYLGDNSNFLTDFL